MDVTFNDMTLELDMPSPCSNLLVMSVNFLPGTPKDIKYNNVKVSLEGIEGVVAAHSLHIWSLTVNKAALAVHLAIGVCMNKTRL